MAKIAAPLVLFSCVSWLPVSGAATVDSAEVADDQACEMQTSLLQTKTEMRDTTRHRGKLAKSQMLEAIEEAKAKIGNRHVAQHLDDTKVAEHTKTSHLLAAVAAAKAKVVHVSKQEACAIADETDDNTAIASLVPNNGFVCYQGTKRELDQAYCLLGTAPTRALYRAGDSPWFQGDDVPADVEVQFGSCESRTYDNLLHNPDDCWAPVQKWIRSGEEGEADFAGWEVAQGENWANYDSYYAPDGMNMGIFLSGCICLPGCDVMDAMDGICEDVDQESFMRSGSDDNDEDDNDEDAEEVDRSPGRVARFEACAIADENDENRAVASLVPNNGFVCYEGTKRELDQAYCFLGTAPTRALYRAGDSPWFQGDEVPADVLVELGSCESRGYNNLLHSPDDCWAPVQKWIRSGEEGDADFAGWEVAQMENWANYDSHYTIQEGSMGMGIFMSGCICLPGTDVIHAMGDLCVDVEPFLPL